MSSRWSARFGAVAFVCLISSLLTTQFLNAKTPSGVSQPRITDSSGSTIATIYENLHALESPIERSLRNEQPVSCNVPLIREEKPLGSTPFIPRIKAIVSGKAAHSECFGHYIVFEVRYCSIDCQDEALFGYSGGGNYGAGYFVTFLDVPCGCYTDNVCFN